jgi:hypothetical protein
MNLVGRRLALVILLMALVTLGSFLLGYRSAGGRGVPFVARQTTWSIGIYEGANPWDMWPAGAVSNPVLTAADVTDARALFVADPFLIREGDVWYMFHEVWDLDENNGDIAVSTSRDGYHWQYQQIVLDHSFRLSFPFVVKWEGQFYMIPESQKADGLRLYHATEFPTRWQFVKQLLPGQYADPCILRYEDRWWLFTGVSYPYDTLRLHYADQLEGPWVEHPSSPVVRDDPARARPAGRVIETEGRLLRVAMDCTGGYGRGVRMMQITELTPESYSERQVVDRRVLGPSGREWNAAGMHTLSAWPLDSGRWLACVDGQRVDTVFALGR